MLLRCKHYFCEKCALAQYKKSTRCFICNTQTNGVFNPAKDIIKKMEESDRAASESE
jgi:RING finger protein 113A